MLSIPAAGGGLQALEHTVILTWRNKRFSTEGSAGGAALKPPLPARTCLRLNPAQGQGKTHQSPLWTSQLLHWIIQQQLPEEPQPSELSWFHKHSWSFCKNSTAVSSVIKRGLELMVCKVPSNSTHSVSPRLWEGRESPGFLRWALTPLQLLIQVNQTCCSLLAGPWNTWLALTSNFHSKYWVWAPPSSQSIAQVRLLDSCLARTPQEHH